MSDRSGANPRYKNLVLALNHAFNTGDLSGVDELLTPDFAERDMPPGPEGYKTAVRRLRAALDEPRSEVLGLVAEGSTVVLRVRLTGVHIGEIVGVAPTRRQVNVEQIHFYEGRDGRLATHHYIRNDLALLDQLGVRSDLTLIVNPRLPHDPKPTATKFATMARFAG
ncbi:putative ester cyclase [Kibdelosporangium banguiense]|uniref:Ester cyclase n=1 Tax=Kibdelosporangium banguiense TaxID=1365924 RepID=A0ABS4T6N9_9PSEU|nr:ester cyclase [Kibdelosporangium banguiense]MBP2320086.1 putative ester cyclase [Kibdelosporangium banguiense]